MHHPHISSAEWRRVVIFALLVMGLTTLPYVVGWASQTADWRFAGFMFGLDDGNSYLAKMRQGAQGDWLFHIVYTSEPHDGTFVFVPYLLLGKLAALLVDPRSPALFDAMLIVFHAARIVLGVALIVVIYRFVSLFLAAHPARFAALLLICLAGGFGWILILLGQDNWLGSTPIDFYLPEGYSFFVLYGLPHVALARACLFGGLMLLFAALRQPDARRGAWRALAAGACWLVMGLCVPFYIAVLYAILGLWGVAVLFTRLLARRDLSEIRALIGYGVLATAVPLPYLIYTAAVFATNPIMQAWQGQNVLSSPHPLHYLIGYGLLAALAACAAGWAWRRGAARSSYLLLVVWVVTLPVLVYLPVAVQRRLSEGVFVPLCILAVAGTRRLLRLAALPRRDARRRWRWAMSAVIILTLPSTALLLLSGTLSSLSPGDGNRLFNSTPILNALDALNAASSRDQIVLSSVSIGNLLPARTHLRAYVGHGPETIRFADKAAAAERLLNGEMAGDEVTRLIESGRISYIVLTDEQWTRSQTRIRDGRRRLDLIYNKDSIVVLKVN